MEFNRRAFRNISKQAKRKDVKQTILKTKDDINADIQTQISYRMLTIFKEFATQLKRQLLLFRKNWVAFFA